MFLFLDQGAVLLSSLQSFAYLPDLLLRRFLGMFGILGFALQKSHLASQRLHALDHDIVECRELLSPLSNERQLRLKGSEEWPGLPQSFSQPHSATEHTGSNLRF